MPRRRPLADRTSRQQENLRRTPSPGPSRREATSNNSQNLPPHRNFSQLFESICQGVRYNERALRRLFIFLFEWGTLFIADDHELQNLLRTITRSMDEAAEAADRILNRTEQSSSRSHQR